MSNICESCLIARGDEVPDYKLFDTGECAACGKFGDVADPALLEIYRVGNIPNADVWEYLPRVRHHKLEETPLTDNQINDALANYFAVRTDQ
jgi:hypothetical protein